MNRGECDTPIKPATAEGLRADIIPVLSISPIADDHASLKRIVNNSASRWRVHQAPTLRSGLAVLKENRIPIVVTERDLSPGTWKEVLAETMKLPNPPLLIVTARLGDERLWSEILNSGCWDLIQKPFNREEVLRVLNVAWSHWKANVRDGRIVPLKMAAAG